MADLKDILKDKGIEYKNTNNPAEIVIQCTSGEHEDANPSLSFNLEKQVFHCFSCGFQGGIGKFLQSIGITQKIHIDSKQEYKILKLKRKLQSIKNTDNIRMPNALNMINWVFNGIDANVLRDFMAFTTTEYGLEEYITIPVFQFGRLKFLDARRRHSDESKSKYTRKPENIKIADVLFPVDKIDKVNHVILTEGMYDMLNLWQHGVRNVLCIFGANNFGKEKIELLNKLGITKVTVLMDGDAAGRRAAERIEFLLEKNDFLTYRITLQPDEDPGMLSKEYLYQILGKVHKAL